MPDILRIEVEDDRVGDGLVWCHEVPVGTSMAAIGAAIETLYPTAKQVSIFVSEPEIEAVGEEE